MSVRLGILRPAGVLGDENDGTRLEGSRVSGSFQIPGAPVVLEDLAEAPDGIEFVRFFMRAGWYSGGVGPLNPQAWMQWRVGSLGSYGVSESELPPAGVGVFGEFVSLDQPTQPDGSAWTLAAVNNLQMRTGWFADDGGSGETTIGAVAELWAEPWGPDSSPPPPPPPPVDPGDVEVERVGETVETPFAQAAGGGDGAIAQSVESPYRQTAGCGVVETVELHGGSDQEAF